METIDSAVQRIYENQAVQEYTAIPCRVDKVVSADTWTVDVKPLINVIYDDGRNTERPVILNVPLMMPASGTSIVNIPVMAGDIVLCVFSMRGLDAFKAGDGTPEPPLDYRIFDMRDAIAIPGLFPFAQHPNQRLTAFDPTALSITHNVGTPLEATVSIDAAGQINAVSPVMVNINAPIINLNGVLTINGLPYLGHLHSGVTTGPGSSGPVVV